MIELSDQQRQAVEDIQAWYRDPRAPQVYRLFGYAGTGKTTLARHIAGLLCPDGSVHYAAFTGKAADVLRRKGCFGASTIHRLIYKPTGKSRQMIRELQDVLAQATDPADRKRLEQEIAVAEEEAATPNFTLNPDSDLTRARLLILDEVSMVPEFMANDLESFGVRILCLGDPAQLPPVKGSGHYTGVRPDTLLTEIHRSALESPVTKLATIARNSDDRLHGIRGMIGESGRSTAPVSMSDFDQVLVGKNATRWNLIYKIRKMAGNGGKAPQPGEPIIILANNSDVGVFNGQQFTVIRVADDGRGITFGLTVSDDTGAVRDLLVYADGFTGPDEEATVQRLGWKGPVAAATYAHAITVHKAQGSQWPHVLVIDESSVFRQNAKEWFYTAITRASEQVVIRPASR